MSTSQTSTMPGLQPSEDSISSLTFWPLEVLRQPRITLLAPRLTMCFAASLPRPELAPVMMTVLEANEAVGLGILRMSRVWTKLPKEGMIVRVPLNRFVVQRMR